MTSRTGKYIRFQRLTGVSLAISLAFASPGAHPQTGSTQQGPTVDPKGTQRPLRLSDWLLGREGSDEDYPLGLSLRFTEEVPAQSVLRMDLLRTLSGTDKDIKAVPEAVKRLRDWLATLPVTGRVAVSSADGRWLQVNPARNPVLRPGYSIVMPHRPRTVTVIDEHGARCLAVHKAGFEARAYVQACRGAGFGGADWAWIAQPDGRIPRFGVALWNTASGTPCSCLSHSAPAETICSGTPGRTAPR